MRHLASIRRVTELLPIPGADMIEVAHVGGWKCVVKKGEFKPNDLGVYYEIDSFLPTDNPEFEFLAKSSTRTHRDSTTGYKIRTVCLRGQVSQGLFMPLHKSLENAIEGDDVTALLNVRLFEAPIPVCLEGSMKGEFPSGLFPHTDVERIQNLSNDLPELKKLKWEVTEKIEGASESVYIRNGEFGVCSSNTEYLDTPENMLWTIAKQLKLKEKLEKSSRNLAVQGEIHGSKIQGNIYQKDISFACYSVVDIDTYKYLTPTERRALCEELDIPHVPTIATELDLDQFETVEDIVAYADGMSVLNPAVRREGLVFKSTDGSRMFKAVSNKYLLGQKD